MSETIDATTMSGMLNDDKTMRTGLSETSCEKLTLTINGQNQSDIALTVTDTPEMVLGSVPEVASIIPAKINSDSLKDLSSFERTLSNSGVKQEMINFIKAVVAPKGHPDYLSTSNAATKFLDMTSPGATYNAFSALTNMFRQMYHGDFVAADKKEKKVGEGRTRSQNRDKAAIAEDIARKNISLAFKKENGLATRGRIEKEKKAAYDQYIIDHLPSEIESVLANGTPEPVLA